MGHVRKIPFFRDLAIELRTCCICAYFKEIPVLHAASLTKYNIKMLLINSYLT